MYKTQGIPNSRIEIADALRGIAVMGIVLFHALENFNLFVADKSMTLPTDEAVFSFCEMLFAGKMYGIFALLFGVSFFIMRDNQEQRGKDFSARFAWRMVLLFAIGLVNMAFYNGDILTTYAVLGLLMIPAGYLPTRWLWGITILLLIQPIEIYLVLTGQEIPTQELWAAYERVGEINQHGTFFESALANLREGFRLNWGWFLWKGRLTQTLGFFLLGILVGRLRWLYDEGSNLRRWRRILCISLPLAVLGAKFDAGAYSVWTAPITSMLLLMCEVSVIVLLWYGWPSFQRLLTHVCFFGRMSLSNYLLQSIFGSMLFYGWGFALCDDLGATWSLLAGIGIITVQILLLKQWSKKHARGPMETLWRKSTWIGRE